MSKVLSSSTFRYVDNGVKCSLLVTVVAKEVESVSGIVSVIAVNSINHFPKKARKPTIVNDSIGLIFVGHICEINKSRVVFPQNVHYTCLRMSPFSVPYVRLYTC